MTQGWSIFTKILKDCHTHSDNITYDWAKVTGTFSVACLLWYTWYHLDNNKVFDPVQFSTALCAIIGTVCVGVAAKTIATNTANLNRKRMHDDN
jgi:hypothetical protein